MIRRIRLVTGLILAAFVTLHLLNLCLGVLSISAMEAMRIGLSRVWDNPVGTTALIGALAIHMGLGFYWVYERTHFHLPVHEWIRLVLGFLIPFLAAGHFIGGFVTTRTLGIDISYPFVLSVLYNNGWSFILRQTLLVLAVWAHMAMGIHLWLRLKPWYAKVQTALWPLALLVPAMALSGYARATLDAAERLKETDYASRLFAERRAASAEIDAFLTGLEAQAFTGLLLLLAVALLARQIRRAYRNRHGTVLVTYPSGDRVTIPLGFTILDASRIGRIPHAGVCGGRGRCSTCRVRVGAGLAELPAAGIDEAAVLARVEAAPDVRLACQTRPRRNLTVTPLLPPTAGVQQALRPGGVTGHEKRVVVLFIDIRGSTRMGERSLPYDVVFTLNEFFAEMSAALRATGGHYAQFNGDGLMALYGLEVDFPTACRQAIEGAAEMFRRLDGLNRRFAGELSDPLRIGIGIHGGEAIVGTMGPPASPILSAIGDTVNIAARLEAETKVVGRPLVMSRLVAETAGISLGDGERYEVVVTGREGPIPIVAIADPEALVLRRVGS